jgi:hypothetical protein
MLRPFGHLWTASSCAPKTHSTKRKKRSNDLANPLDVPPSSIQSFSKAVKSTVTQPNRPTVRGMLRIVPNFVRRWHHCGGCDHRKQCRPRWLRGCLSFFRSARQHGLARRLISVSGVRQRRASGYARDLASHWRSGSVALPCEGISLPFPSARGAASDLALTRTVRGRSHASCDGHEETALEQA